MSLALALIILFLVFPNLFDSTNGLIERDFVQCIGIGALTFFMTPVVAIVFMVTVIGIPLGILLFIAYGLVLLLALFAVIYYLGDRLLVWAGFDKQTSLFAKIIAVISAVFLIALIKLLPLIGPLFVFLAMLMGLGAIMMYMFKRSPAVV